MEATVIIAFVDVTFAPIAEFTKLTASLTTPTIRSRTLKNQTNYSKNSELSMFYCVSL